MPFQWCVLEMVCISQIEWNVQFRERSQWWSWQCFLSVFISQASPSLSLRRPAPESDRTFCIWTGSLMLSVYKMRYNTRKTCMMLNKLLLFYFTGGTITLETGQASRSMACCHGSMNIRSLFYNFSQKQIYVKIIGNWYYIVAVLSCMSPCGSVVNGWFWFIMCVLRISRRYRSQSRSKYGGAWLMRERMWCRSALWIPLFPT